jgi:hypothetical protein
MKTTAAFHNLISWLKTTELFFNPDTFLPGRWVLYEYYTEPGNELIHVQEKQLREEKQSWTIEFTSDKKFDWKTNLPVHFLSGMKAGNWKRSKNYLTMSDSRNPALTLEFQFAFEKENLKLLKKDSAGKIEIFGFFRK